MHSLRPVFFILYSRREVIVLNTRQLSMDIDYVSDRCRELRKHAKKSLDDMAYEAGMGRNTIFRIESGERIPDIEQLFRYCYALDISIINFLPPSVQSPGSSTQSQTLQASFLQLNEDSKKVALSTFSTLVEQLLAQQNSRS